MPIGQTLEILGVIFFNAPYGFNQPDKTITRRCEGCMTLVIARTDYP